MVRNDGFGGLTSKFPSHCAAMESLADKISSIRDAIELDNAIADSQQRERCRVEVRNMFNCVQGQQQEGEAAFLLLHAEIHECFHSQMVCSFALALRASHNGSPSPQSMHRSTSIA
mmetsp:Transcript_81339/g.242406  ORF Transcript_81339/g.242406 Transcript_81339/m.242406 type:complete len:116 (+) Transcript_81339:525-872(+)